MHAVYVADGVAHGQHFTARRWAEERGDHLREWSTLGGLRATCRARFGPVAHQQWPDAQRHGSYRPTPLRRQLRSDGRIIADSTVHGCAAAAGLVMALTRGGRPSIAGLRGSLRACPCVAGCGTSDTNADSHSGAGSGSNSGSSSSMAAGRMANICTIGGYGGSTVGYGGLGSGPIDGSMASAADGDALEGAFDGFSCKAGESGVMRGATAATRMQRVSSQFRALIRGGRPSTVGRRGSLRACPCVAGCGSSTMHTVRALNGLAAGVRALRAAVAGGRCRVYAVSCAVWVAMPRLYCVRPAHASYLLEMESSAGSPLLFFSGTSSRSF